VNIIMQMVGHNFNLAGVCVTGPCIVLICGHFNASLHLVSSWDSEFMSQWYIDFSAAIWGMPVRQYIKAWFT
jgi:hypothetical protein